VIAVQRDAVMAVAAWVLASGALGCSSSGGAAPDSQDASIDALSTDGAPDASVRDGAYGDGDGGASTSDAADDAGPPSLVALGVSAQSQGDSSLPVTLIPAFSPGTHDYYVRCAAGANALTVSLKASPGASSLLVQPTASPSLPEQTLSVSVNEDQAVVAAATDGTATAEYWVRCLPHDFPLLQWTPHPDAGTPPRGYYLIGTGVFTGPGGVPATPTSGCFAMMLDANGVPVWYARAPWANGYCVFDVDDVVPGAVSFDSIADNPAEFEVRALSPTATTTVAPRTDAGALNVDLHELRLLPNGNYLVISSPPQPGVDLTGMRVPLTDGGIETLNGPQTILACDLLEVEPNGTVVWTWSATDHFDAVADSVVPTLTAAGPFGNDLVDPFHCNSVDVEPVTGNLLVSAREMNSVFCVERASGRVLWKMGGAVASKDGATYVSVADPFALQHDARFQPDWSPTCSGGSGTITLFDDETYASRPARAVAYDVVVGGADGGSAATNGCGDAGTAGTASMEWQHAGPTSSFAMGSFRIGADGSRVIGWGLMPGGGFAEVDSHGSDLLDFAFADGNATYRAIKVPTSAFDLGVLRSTAGLP
jgi:uncharacterized protein YndB with AHSA1/START domain